MPLITRACGWCGQPVKDGEGRCWLEPFIVGVHHGDCEERYRERLRETHEQIASERKGPQRALGL